MDSGLAYMSAPQTLTPVPTEYTVATLNNLIFELRRLGVDSITVPQLERLVENQPMMK